MKFDGPGCVKSSGPGFASAAAREGEQIAEEQRGEVTGGDENAREGLAKPGQRKTDLNLVFREPG